MNAKAIGDSGTNKRRRFRLWVWPLWAFVAVLCVSAIHLLFFTSNAGSRIVVSNDTSARLHLFECRNGACTEGVRGSDWILDPGEAAADVWDSSDGIGRV